jgi:cation:H+ antiporter
VNVVTDFVQQLGLDHPITFTALFVAVSLLMIWRLEAMAEHGLEGTALGTLITPYCSGFGNLAFVYLMVRERGNGAEVMTNCLVNNVTNLTLLLGLPALLWSLEVIPAASAASGGARKKGGKGAAKQDTERRLSRLSLLLTMAAVGFFSAAVWVLGQDGVLDATDGVVLVGLFLFWQCFQVVDVLKNNVRRSQRFGLMFYLDGLVLICSAVVVYESLEWLVDWMSSRQSGFFREANLGWLSGWLMVLPNAVLALYYGARRRADVVYASQVGDGHICIPLCVGLYAIAQPMQLPPMFQNGLRVLGGALAVHLIFVGTLGRMPKPMGWVFVAAYSWFVYTGLV